MSSLWLVSACWWDRIEGGAERITARGSTWQAVPDVVQFAEQVAFLGDVQAIEWLPF